MEFLATNLPSAALIEVHKHTSTDVDTVSRSPDVPSASSTPAACTKGAPRFEGGWIYRMMYVPTADLADMLNHERRPLIGTLHFETVIDDPLTMWLLYGLHC